MNELTIQKYPLSEIYLLPERNFIYISEGFKDIYTLKIDIDYYFINSNETIKNNKNSIKAMKGNITRVNKKINKLNITSFELQKLNEIKESYKYEINDSIRIITFINYLKTKFNFNIINNINTIIKNSIKIKDEQELFIEEVIYDTKKIIPFYEFVDFINCLNEKNIKYKKYLEEINIENNESTEFYEIVKEIQIFERKSFYNSLSNLKIYKINEKIISLLENQNICEIKQNDIILQYIKIFKYMFNKINKNDLDIDKQYSNYINQTFYNAARCEIWSYLIIFDRSRSI